jgi:TonB-dependent receptor
MEKHVTRFARFVMVLLGVSVLSATAFAQTGRVAGKVTEATTKASLPGATVVLVGTNFGAVTDQQGYFIISNVPAGSYDVSVRYVGYEKGSKNVTVSSDKVAEANFSMKSNAVELKTVNISAARVASSQSTALNTQKEATNIKNVVASDLIGAFPDVNAAEALSRIPALSITRDQGEGRFVIIRGIDPKYNSSTLNGERIPSGDRVSRLAELDIVPADLIETIEVSKALTADMDADAIGGSINLITKEPRDRRTFSVTSAYGLNAQKIPTREGNSPHIARFGIVTGDSFDEGKFAYLLGGSYYDNNWKNDTHQSTIATDSATIANNIKAGTALSDGTLTYQQRDYEEHRTRVGLNGSFLYKPSLGNKYYVKSTFTQFYDHEFRFSTIDRYSDFQKRREGKYRKLTETTPNVMIGGENLFANGIKVDYRGSYVKAIYDRPNEITNFRFLRRFTDNTLATPRKGAGFPDTLGYVFDNLDLRTEYNTDRNKVVAANLLVPYNFNTLYGNLKFGVKGAFKHRNTSVALDQLRRVSTQYPSAIYLPGGVNTDQFPPQWEDFAPTQAAVIWTQGITSPANLSQTYDAKENVSAAYALSEISPTRRLLIVPGVRLEHTSTDYLSALPNSTRQKADYDNWLPSAHVRFQMTPNTNLRLSATRAISRPDYFNLVPVDYMPDATTRILGNPDLKPVVASNYDLMFELYDPKLAGIISAGLFAKHLDNPVEMFSETVGGVTTTQPRNSGEADITGFEFAVQQNLGIIGLRNFGILANYTYADSKVKELTTNRERPLVGQSKHLASAALSYETAFGFSGLVSWQFKGKQIEASGTSNVSDTYEADYSRFDLSASQKVGPNMSIFLQGSNLNDAPLHFYFNNPVTKKPFDVQVEHYGPTWQLGAKWNML